MAQTRATKAVKPTTSALNASARRNPSNAVTVPCWPTFHPIEQASAATIAKALRLSRSHHERELTSRHSTLVIRGTAKRSISAMLGSFLALAVLSDAHGLGKRLRSGD